MSSYELTTDNTNLLARIMELQQRLQQIEAEEGATARERAQQTAQWRDQQTGRYQSSGAPAAPAATGPFSPPTGPGAPAPTGREAQIQTVMDEMRARGLGRI